MSDPHDRFAAWVADGAAGDLPRDVALHAAGCDECLAVAGALDALAAVNLDAVELPPMLAVPARGASPLATIARRSAGAAALGLLALVVAALGSGWPLDQSPSTGDAAALEPSARAEGVLGGAAGPSPSEDDATPSPTGSPDATPTATNDPAATSAAAPVQPAPTTRQIPTAGPTVPAATPPPSATPTPVPSPSTPAPTATPRPTTTPTPTPTPTPATPTPLPTASATPSPTPTPTP